MRNKSVSITELPPSPDDERRSRMIKYAITQAIRLACIILCFVLPVSWWTLLPAAGAVFLPYFAVVAANSVQQRGRPTVQRPGAVVRSNPTDTTGRAA